MEVGCVGAVMEAAGSENLRDPSAMAASPPTEMALSLSSVGMGVRQREKERERDTDTDDLFI